MSLQARRTLAPALLLAVLALLLVPEASVRAAPPPLVAAPSAVDFGLVGVEWGENSASIAVQNSGDADVLVGSATIDGSGAGPLRITNDGCQGQMLSSGASCYINLGFDPSDGIAYAATLHVPSDAGELTVPLAGQGGMQQVTPAPAELDFGAVDVGEAVVRTVTLQNTGNLPYQSIVALPTGSGVGAYRVTQDTCSLRQMDPGDSCTLAVRFAPLAPEEAVANLMVIGGNGAPALVALRGLGRQAAAVVAPQTLAFGDQALRGTSRVQSVAVVNSGNGLLRISSASVGGLDAERFRVVGENCTAAPLAPGATCAVRVRFVPAELGDVVATLRLVTNDAAGVAIAQLTGRGVAAADTASARSAGIAFGWHAGSPAPFALGRVDLGVARCVRALRCHVSVRARVFSSDAGVSAVSAGTVVWRPGRGARISLALPEGMSGTPVLLVATLRIHAAGRPAGTRTIVVPLVHGLRRGSLIMTGIAARASDVR